MKNALIIEGRVVQVENNTFVVAPPLHWKPCPDNCQVGWTYNNSVFTAPDEYIEPPKTQYLPLEFLDLFTDAEQLAVVSATLLSPQVKLWYDKMLGASYVDLEDPRTEAGLIALVGAGLLTQTRKDEIMGV